MRTSSLARALMIVVVAITAACKPKEPPDPWMAVRLGEFDSHYKWSLSGVDQSLRALGQKTSKDFRGQTIGQDLDRWFFAPATRERIESLRSKAEDLRGGAAETALLQAGNLMQTELDRGGQIADYWNGQRPAPYWRDYWRAYFEANGASAPEPDAKLLEQERRVRAMLDTGDFKAANSRAAALNAAFHESMSGASRLLPADRVKKLVFVPRSTPCGPAIQPTPWLDAAKYAGGPPIDSFYPRASIERSEEGAVIMTMRISSSGCESAAAISLHSGIADLDNAALRWAESSRFAPGSSNGRAIDSVVMIKVAFRLEDRQPTR